MREAAEYQEILLPVSIGDTLLKFDVAFQEITRLIDKGGDKRYEMPSQQKKAAQDFQAAFPYF